MSYAHICDLCHKRILVKFSDKSYIVKKKKHFYDGFNALLGNSSVDVCSDCMTKIINGIPKAPGSGLLRWLEERGYSREVE